MFLKLPYESPPLLRNMVLWTFGELLITDVNLLYILYLTAWRRCFLNLIKQNGLLKTFRRSLILMTWISLYLYLFSFLELIWKCIICPMMIKKTIKNLDLWKVPGPDCFLVMVLKNCEPEISYILDELFNKCLKESCIPDCWKVSLLAPVFKNVG